MAENTTVTIPKPLRERLASLARSEHKSQPALIEDMVSKREDELFWASFGDLDAEKYQAAMRADGDEASQDYSLEERMITAAEAGSAG